MNISYLKSSIFFLPCFAILGLYCCQTNPNLDEFPVFGFPTDNGPMPIPDFKFVNQDSQLVTNETFRDQIYISDFFFTSCPTICPKMTKSLKRIYDHFPNEEKLKIVSHTIDQRRDTVARLKWYADKMNVTSNRWHFVTGKKDQIYDIAKYYMSVAQVDDDAAGGYTHSGYLVLVDENRQVRAYCDGTDPEEVRKFILKIEKFLALDEK